MHPQNNSKWMVGDRISITAKVMGGNPLPLKHKRLYLTAVVKVSGQEVEAIRLWDDGSHSDRNPHDGIYHNFFHRVLSAALLIGIALVAWQRDKANKQRLAKIAARSLPLIALTVAFASHLLNGCGQKPSAKQESVTYRKTGQEIQLSSWERELPPDIVLLLDQSGSMSKGKQPTDPNGLRASGSRTFLEFLAQRSSKDQPNRFAVVNFGSHAQRIHAYPLTPVRSPDDPALRSIFAKLTLLELGDTNFIEAMRLGMQLLREGGSFDKPRNRALVIFTDGEPDDARKLSIAQYFAELSEFVKKQVKPAKVDVFVIGIDAVGRKWSGTVSYWQKLVGSDHVFTTPNMPTLKARFNRIVQRIWHLPEVEPAIVSAGSPVEFDLEPYLAAVEFHIFPSRKGLTLNVRRPDGKVVEPGKDDDVPPVKHLSTFDLLVVHDPEPGRWRYEVVGGAGTVEVLRNPIPLRMRLISPAPVHPQGKPMHLIAEFKRADGKPVQSYRDYPLALTADIITSSGKRIPVKFPLEHGRDGVYFGEPTLEAPMELGEYQIMLKVSGGEKYHSTYPVRVQVRPIPYLLIDEPGKGASVPPAAPLSVRVRLLQAGKPLKPQEAFTNHPDYLAIAQIVESPNGQRGEAVWLSAAKEADTPGQFVGDVPMPARAPEEGHYVLAVRLAPEERAKQVLADKTAVEFLVQKPPRPLWIRALMWSLILIGMFAVIIMPMRRWYLNRLRMPIYYWVENQSRCHVIALERANQSEQLSDPPIKVSRIGREKKIKLEPANDAKLLTAAGEEVSSLEITDATRILVQTNIGQTKAVNIGFDSQLRRPESSQQRTIAGEEMGEVPKSDEDFDWGFGETTD